MTVSSIGRSHSTSTQEAAELVKYVTFDAFKFYYDQRREAFYNIERWSDLLYTYQSINPMLEQARKGNISGRFDTDIIGIFETRLEAGSLNRSLLMKYADRFQAQIDKYGSQG